MDAGFSRVSIIYKVLIGKTFTNLDNIVLSVMNIIERKINPNKVICS